MNNDCGGSGRDEKRIDSGELLKVELTGFTKWLKCGSEERMGTSKVTKVFDLNNGKDQVIWGRWWEEHVWAGRSGV